MYKVAKGAIDLVGADYDRIKDICQCIEREFINAGGKSLETPIFERTDVLLGKYGEEADSKLIYRLADCGGESLALRYDLTIPFSRYIKETGLKQMRRYSIGKVYRRDQPNVKSGRYREFIQADFDIYGEKQDGMLAEATLLNAVSRVLKSLGLRFKILINDVRNLTYLLNTTIGIKVGNVRKICSIIDKLDKQSFMSLKTEFMDAGLSEEQIIALEPALASSLPLFPETISNYDKLMSIAKVFEFDDNLVFTNSLARGLDYYTGFIWEFKLEGISSSISAGGRYDGLLDAPTVGISLGVSRLASLVEFDSKSDWSEKYFVTSIGKVSIIDKLRVVKKLQSSVSCPVLYSMTSEDKKLSKVITDCCTSFIRYVVIVGESELTEGKFIIKDLKEKTQIVEIL
jgi:histidyl-tRNA synthetase